MMSTRDIIKAMAQKQALTQQRVDVAELGKRRWKPAPKEEAISTMPISPELLGGSYVQLSSTGEWVKNEDYRNLTEEQKSELNKLGVDKFMELSEERRVEFEKNYVKLDSGEWVAKDIYEGYVRLDSDEWVAKDTYDELTDEDRVKLNELGVDKFNEYAEKKVKAEVEAGMVATGYVKIDKEELIDKKDFDKLSKEEQDKFREEWISKKEFSELIKEEQGKLKELGIVGFDEWCEERYGEGFTKLAKDEQEKLKKEWVSKKELDKSIRERYEESFNNLLKEEWVGKKELEALTKEEQVKLSELGVEGFNEWRNKQYEEEALRVKSEYEAKVAALTPKTIPLKSGTGRWKAYSNESSGYFIRTKDGDMPAWMLLSDTSGKWYGPDTTFADIRTVQGIRYVWQYPNRYKKVGKTRSGLPIFETFNELWTEETWLAHIGRSPGDVTGIINRMAQGGEILPDFVAHYLFDTSGWTYIDPETGEKKSTEGLVNPYGVYDSTGKKIGDVGTIAPFVPRRWPESVKEFKPLSAATSTGIIQRWPEQVSSAMPEIKFPGQWPSVVSSPAVLAAKLSVEELKMQIARGEIIEAKDGVLIPKVMFEGLSREEQYRIRTEGAEGTFVQTAKGEIVRADFVDGLLESDRKLLMEQGYDAYIRKVGAESVQIAGGMWMPKADYEKLSPKDQEILQEQGYEAYISKLEENNIRLADGMWMPKADFEKFSPEDQKILQEQGYDAYINKLSETYELLPDGQWIPKESDAKKGIVGINDLPKPQQDILRKDGVDVWKKKLSEWERALLPFVIKMEGEKPSLGEHIPFGKDETFPKEHLPLEKGETFPKEHLPLEKSDILGYDLISARRFIEGGYDAVATLPKWFEDKGINLPEGLYKLPWLEGLDKEGIKEAISGFYNPEEVEKLTANAIIVPKDTWEKLQIVSEETASQKSIDHWVANNFLQNIGVLRGQSFEESKATGEVLQQSLVGVSPNLLPYIVGASVAISSFSEGVHNFLKTGPFWAKPAPGALLGVADLLITVPTTILSSFLISQSLASEAQKAETKEEHDRLMAASNASIIGLGAGLVSWMAGRPQAIKEDPWLETPYTAVMIIGPEKLAGMAKAAGLKLDPRRMSDTAIALEPDVGRITTPKSEIGLYNPHTGKFDYDVYMSPARSRELIAAVQKRIIEQIPEGVLEVLKTGHDVVIKMPDGTVVGHLSAFQQSIPSVLWHAHPDQHTNYVNTINTKSRIQVSGEGGEYGGFFMSGKPSALFLARRAPKDPGYVATIVSPNDFRDLPSNVAKLLDAGKLKEAKEMFYGMGKRGELGDYVFPLAKWYNKIPRLEDEMWASPTFYLNKATKVPWYLKEKDVSTGINYTTSPIEAKIEGVEIKSGQDIPILWLLSDRAITEGRTLPTLAQFYKAELLDFVTTARKMMPWNIKLRKWTLSEEVAVADTMFASKFTGLVIKNKAKSVPEWEWEIHKKPEGGWTRPQEAWIFDAAGRRLRSRVTGIVRDPQGRIMLVWDKVDKAWNLPGGRHDPYGEIGRDPKTGYVSTPEQALYGQILHETGVKIDNIAKVGTHQGKVTSHSLYGQDVFVAEAKNPNFDLKKYTKKGEVPELRDAMWWDGKSPTPRGDVYPAVVDVLKSAKWVDTKPLKVYKDTPDILMKARDKGFGNRYSVDWQGRQISQKVQQAKSVQSKIAPTLPKLEEVKVAEKVEIKHRGTDLEAIGVAEEHNLSFDGMQEGFEKGEPSVYQFTTQMPEAKNITFYVDKLSEVPTRLSEKLAEFGIKPKIAEVAPKVAVIKTESPTIKTLDDFVKTDDAVVKIQLDAFGEKLSKSAKDGDVTFFREMTSDGKETSRFIIRVKEGKEAYISRPKEFENRRIEGEIELQYGDYVRSGDTGIAFIPKEGGLEYWAGVEAKFAKPEIIGKITPDIETELKELGYSKEQIVKMTPQEAWEKVTVSDITRNTEKRIDEIVIEVKDRAIERAEKGENYEQAFVDEVRKMRDELVSEFDRYSELPYRVRLERMRLPLLGESRVEAEQRSDEIIKQFVDDRIKAGETGRRKLEAEARLESRVEAIAEPRLRIGTEPKVEGGLEPEIEPHLEPKIEPRIEPKVEPRIEPRIEPAKEAVVEPRIETGVEPKAEPRLEFLVSPEAVPEARVGVEPRTEPIPEPRVEPIPRPVPKPFPNFEAANEYIKKYGIPPGSLMWKQGWCYKHIFPPWQKDDILNTKKPLPQVHYATGVGSAYESAVATYGGELPGGTVMDRDMGLFRLHFVPREKGTDPGIHFALKEEEASWSPENIAEREAEEAQEVRVQEIEEPKVAKEIEEPKIARKIEKPKVVKKQDIEQPEVIEQPIVETQAGTRVVGMRQVVVNKSQPETETQEVVARAEIPTGVQPERVIPQGRRVIRETEEESGFAETSPLESEMTGFEDKSPLAIEKSPLESSESGFEEESTFGTIGEPTRAEEEIVEEVDESRIIPVNRNWGVSPAYRPVAKTQKRVKQPVEDEEEKTGIIMSR